MSGGGYPLEWFSEPLDNSLKCGICTKVLREPRVTPCGHVYCSLCLIPWLDSYGVCPLRCREVEVDSLRRRVQLSKFISGLFTHCKNKRAGCTEQVPLIKKHSHEKNCPYRNYSASGAKSNSSGRTDVSLISATVSPISRGKHKRTKSSVSASLAISPVVKVTRSPSAADLCRIQTKLPASAVSDMVSQYSYQRELIPLCTLARG